MKISASYKLISTLLSLSIILSFMVSLCSINTMEEMCEQMMMDHGSMKMSEMIHDTGHKDLIQNNHASESAECEMSLDCDCVSEQEVIGTIAPTVLLKINVSSFVLSEKINKTVFKGFSKSNSELKAPNPYLSPPLFLANESFLI